MVDSSAFSGDFSKNPLRFQHFDIDSLGFTVNGEPTPKEAFQYDMEKIYLLMPSKVYLK